MDHFAYRDGQLHVEDVDLRRIAEQVGTPVYVYAQATLTRHFQVFAGAFSDLDALVCYAVKANGNLSVIRVLAGLGAGADVVSIGEMQVALVAGVPANRIVFSGVGKTESEIAAALKAGVLQINVESEPELRAVDRVARSLGVRAPVALRVNPDIDAHTHAKISTGMKENKFGIEWTLAHRIYAEAATLSGVLPVGVAVHIGSQLTELSPFRDAFLRVRDLIAMLRADGLGITSLDIGGGLGIPYGNEEAVPPSPADYAGVVRPLVGDLGCRLILEPGRLVVGNAGILLTRVIYVKEGATRTFVVVDAGMNDLMRPALYDAFHRIVPIRAQVQNEATMVADVVGPICESSDVFGTERVLPRLVSGDLLAIRTAGAYGASMSSMYNARPLIAEAMVSGDRCAVVRRRFTVEEFLALQSPADWLTSPNAAIKNVEAVPIAAGRRSGIGT